MASHVESLEEIKEICIERDISTPELDEKISDTIKEMNEIIIGNARAADELEKAIKFATLDQI
jgi:hypothetical protein